MNDLPDLVDGAKRFDDLCRNIFGSGQGAELLKLLKVTYCDGALYQDTDRATAYCIGQRDLVLEIADRIKHRSDGVKLDGVETNE